MPAPLLPHRIQGSEEAAFTLSYPERPAVPIVIAAPHGGRRYPQDVVDAMRDPGRATLKLEDRLIDLLAAEVARRMPR